VVLARYHDEREIADIAATTGRTVEAVYRLLSRIRAALNTCISRNLGAAGRSA
jgi:RNA polymerase sigma-70 factor (ECF subfamily)